MQISFHSQNTSVSSHYRDDKAPDRGHAQTLRAVRLQETFPQQVLKERFQKS